MQPGCQRLSALQVRAKCSVPRSRRKTSPGTISLSGGIALKFLRLIVFAPTVPLISRGPRGLPLQGPEQGVAAEKGGVGVGVTGFAGR